ncbi:MAG: hypothetical protein UU37_C0004G0020 [Candidatus Gottesmanbacteria bacterium GW2011_GWA2_41_12]|uniref:Uncharacterized protein n=2 Tax=Candidatus Gottesmaniibacteriota TaxID=1752720 RepID=A0A0G0XL17_9BACT|nr:MAG: hypothetical protein UT63_C0041G0007 [Candidatus Gottesmanbacteria bacterium GW2011_GWC2_39_8]KKR88402.1 MAG: hypothetical protein UU37_C0004G0020 [Candidatus Gottesmanbacteria bacterium GW2011_GWA2_41_12]
MPDGTRNLRLPGFPDTTKPKHIRRQSTPHQRSWGRMNLRERGVGDPDRRFTGFTFTRKLAIALRPDQIETLKRVARGEVRWQDVLTK